MSAPRAYLEPAPLTQADRTALNGRVFDATWQLVRDRHFDRQLRGVDWAAMPAKYRAEALAAPDDAALYRILDRMCGELHESHLTPLPPRRSHEIRTDRRVAVGMGWMPLDGRNVVTDLVPGSPAAEAGVEPGWIIISCEGFPLGDRPVPSPQPGRPITYGFLDLGNEPRTITFQPELLKLEQLTSRGLPGGHRYLRFDRFDRESLLWLNRELKAHRDAPGVIIDLRDNPGGYLYTANLAIAQFFARRVATGQAIRRSGRISESHGWPLLSARYPGRVVVLTSPSTASAAEIFAHVLQHEKRATLVGRRTAGAVVISRTYPLPGGGTLQVPIQDYRGRDGRRLEGHGVSPDLNIPAPALDDLRQGRDPDLAGALALLTAPNPTTLAAARD